MKLEKLRTEYQAASGSASDHTRKLDFAGIAVIWVFRVEADGVHSLHWFLLIPLCAFVASLACDLAQYVYCSLLWGILHRVKEKRGTKEEEEFGISPYCNWPTLFFFWGKMILCLIGYPLLLLHILWLMLR